jgi:hypothetical protein
VATALLAIVVVCALLAAVVAIQAFLSSPTLGESLPLVAQQSSSAFPAPPEKDGHKFIVTLLFNRLKTDDRTVDATAFIQVGDEVLANIYDKQTDQLVYDDAYPHDGEWYLADATDKKITLMVVDNTSGQFFPFQFPLAGTMSTDLGDEPTWNARASLGQLMLIGSPVPFPEDAYSWSLSISDISLPEPLAWSKEGSATYRPRFDLNVMTGAGFADRNVIYQADFTRPNEWVRLKFAANRLIRNVVFIYAVASVPFLIALVFVHVWLTSKFTNLQQIQPSIAGLVSGLVTVLPLRLVLVPADVGGLTHLDYFLGTEMLLLLAAAMLPYWSYFSVGRVRTGQT